jgi:transcription elongation factor Elf1
MKGLSNLLFVFFILVAIIIFYEAYRRFMELNILHRKPSNNRKAQKKTNQTSKKVPCPICNSVLYGSETLYSTVYKTTENKEQVCIIHGCPHCYPVPEAGIVRTCPVCHKKLSAADHLDAYLFSRPDKKSHIHITGCNLCGLHTK